MNVSFKDRVVLGKENRPIVGTGVVRWLDRVHDFIIHSIPFAFIIAPHCVETQLKQRVDLDLGIGIPNRQWQQLSDASPPQSCSSDGVPHER